MKQAEIETLQAMDQLADDQRWAQIREYLREAYNDAIDNLLKAPADELSQYRAEANVLHELTTTIDDAPDAVRRVAQHENEEQSTTGTPT